MSKQGKKANKVRSLRKDRTDYTPSPFAKKEYEQVNREAPPLILRAIPKPNSGIRIPSQRENFEMASNPAMQRAIDLVERVYECETGLKRSIRKQLVKDKRSDDHAAVTKKAIDLAMRRNKGLI